MIRVLCNLALPGRHCMPQLLHARKRRHRSTGRHHLLPAHSKWHTASLRRDPFKARQWDVSWLHCGNWVSVCTFGGVHVASPGFCSAHAWSGLQTCGDASGVCSSAYLLVAVHVGILLQSTHVLQLSIWWLTRRSPTYHPPLASRTT